jgi:hypothetical protein
MLKYTGTSREKGTNLFSANEINLPLFVFSDRPKTNDATQGAQTGGSGAVVGKGRKAM